MNDKIEKILTAKGWMRLWMTGSAVWFGFCTLLVIGDLMRGYTPLSELIQIIFWSVFLPILALCAGFAIRWVIRGFIS